MLSLLKPRWRWELSLVAALLSLLFIDIAHAETAKDVIAKITELTDTINKYDEKEVIAPKVLTDLRTLLLSKKLIGPNAAPAFIEISGEIQAILNDEKSRNQIVSNKDGPASAKALFDALMKISDDQIVKDRFTDLLNKATSLVLANDNSVILSNQTILRTAILQKVNPATTLQNARSRFDGAYATLVEDYKIHVIRAWFGDLRTNWSEGQLCSATPYVMTKCQRQASCQLDEAPQAQAGKAFNQITPCGFDPAPLVDDRYKGVAIKYACVRGSKDSWDKLAEHPGYHPISGEAWESGTNSRTVVLRSSGMSLRCPFPAE